MASNPIFIDSKTSKDDKAKRNGSKSLMSSIKDERFEDSLTKMMDD